MVSTELINGTVDLILSINLFAGYIIINFNVGLLHVRLWPERGWSNFLNFVANGFIEIKIKHRCKTLLGFELHIVQFTSNENQSYFVTSYMLRLLCSQSKRWTDYWIILGGFYFIIYKEIKKEKSISLKTFHKAIFFITLDVDQCSGISKTATDTCSRIDLTFGIDEYKIQGSLHLI